MSEKDNINIILDGRILKIGCAVCGILFAVTSAYLGWMGSTLVDLKTHLAELTYATDNVLNIDNRLTLVERELYKSGMLK